MTVVHRRKNSKSPTGFRYFARIPENDVDAFLRDVSGRGAAAILTEDLPHSPEQEKIVEISIYFQATAYELIFESSKNFTIVDDDAMWVAWLKQQKDREDDSGSAD